MKSDQLTAYTAGFVDELFKQGITDAVVSPGSRSTPMAILLSEHPNIKVHLQIDERSAGFYALGLAKAKKNAVALLCTSGTAAANYFPAIIEAHYSHVPLIVLTADRPHELRDSGAPQAIDQIHIYGKYVKWFADAALPESSISMRQYARTLAGRAAGYSTGVPMGPVHLNFPFREPLLPDLELENLWENDWERKRHVVRTSSLPAISAIEADRIAKVIRQAEKGLIVCGDVQSEEFHKHILPFAEKCQFPILADPLSNLRTGGHNKDQIIEYYDSILKDDELNKHFKPDLVIRFGAMPVSKPLFLQLRDHPEIVQLIIDREGEWRDPSLAASEIIAADEGLFCSTVMEFLLESEVAGNEWLSDWKRANHVFREAFSSIEDEPDMFEGKIYSLLGELMPSHSQLIVGNSMPIRDTDTYFPVSEKEITIFANRGANGIDGVVSTAVGIASAKDEPAVLVIGDLSFYHDLNGLLGAKLNDVSLTIILVNNDGGGIFSFLPQSKEEKHFETLFGTPTGLDFKHAADLYDASYSLIKNWDHFKQEFSASLQKRGISLLEIKTNRHERVSFHRDLLQRVSREIKSRLKHD
ncbi:2-succinyl-5-enolpyruvyl-6-hydroxy-3-cyclohexene-1-carboxylic-acid synthase [Metabacillus sp. RGM 3146]|uniref:2-succinyl-5-enolpyruvyl-6-hydroxy-3- cyclohexene-1-carboxylic-acid synthase n=1 Tax=Metabacillus sp. RGM 3146 TaxID=3401092 RepID=UPI003B9AFF1A